MVPPPDAISRVRLLGPVFGSSFRYPQGGVKDYLILTRFRWVGVESAISVPPLPTP
jgi:hypothetical protein